MLVKAAKTDIEQYMDFAYSLALDQTKSGYPLFSDGISTKEEFINHTWTGYKNADQDILLFTIDGAIEGWIQFFYIEQDRYLQTNGFLINRNTQQALEEFIEYARANFAGYDLYLGFPKKNTHAITYLQKSGFKLIEEAYHNIFIFDGSAIQPKSPNLVKITESNFSEFSRIYQPDPDTYWNSERIYLTLNEWIIYISYRDAIAVGYVFARNGEIYGLGYRDHIFDKRTYTQLVSAVLSDLKAAGHKHMTFLGDEESQCAALNIGFSCVGEYVLYVKSV